AFFAPTASNTSDRQFPRLMTWYIAPLYSILNFLAIALSIDSSAQLEKFGLTPFQRHSRYESTPGTIITRLRSRG
ncbi:MAG TPA: hypothetical protein PLN52_14955, partial [Opitutaceae bacterium]|nr:hypothetical protein [Opitutaceae bacterium]